MICYKLDKDLSMEKLAQDINKLLSKQSYDHDKTILCIMLKNITYDDTSMIPKIEYKNIDSPT